MKIRQLLDKYKENLITIYEANNEVVQSLSKQEGNYMDDKGILHIKSNIALVYEDRIKGLMRERGYSFKKIAKLLKVSDTLISDKAKFLTCKRIFDSENREWYLYSLDGNFLLLLSIFFQVSPLYLLGTTAERDIRTFRGAVFAIFMYGEESIIQERYVIENTLYQYAVGKEMIFAFLLIHTAKSSWEKHLLDIVDVATKSLEKNVPSDLGDYLKKIKWQHNHQYSSLKFSNYLVMVGDNNPRWIKLLVRMAFLTHEQLRCLLAMLNSIGAFDRKKGFDIEAKENTIRIWGPELLPKEPPVPEWLKPIIEYDKLHKE